ncbi:unnamed protein product [Trifolium pratense]|uniref:Uncharacterized protein n=1 Tax=Trifolium pratense TaxID=57577 RepID=A0ACB0J686_TRIPR|nr:unnamed protein product [Trifolium pratense]
MEELSKLYSLFLEQQVKIVYYVVPNMFSLVAKQIDYGDTINRLSYQLLEFKPQYYKPKSFQLLICRLWTNRNVILIFKSHLKSLFSLLILLHIVQLNHFTMPFISSFINCFGLSLNSISQVSDYDEKLSKLKSSSSEKHKDNEKSKGASIVVYHFPVNSYLSRL